jgi:hypothetical protein
MSNESVRLASRGEVIEDIEAFGGVVVIVGIESRIESIPIFLNHAPDNGKTIAESLKAPDIDQRDSKDNSRSQVLGLAEHFESNIAHLLPLGFLAGTKLGFGFSARDGFKILEGGMISEILAGRFVIGNRFKHVVNVYHRGRLVFRTI